MATTNYSWNLPVVGGSEGTWGASLNANWTALDTLLGGVSQAEFAKLDGLTATTAELNLLSGQTSLVPSGVIVMWSGSVATIPSGWYICDGTNGTPNLTGRFVVHADADSGGTYNPGDTGGADSVTLTTSQIPSHTHTFSGTTDNASAFNGDNMLGAGGSIGQGAGNLNHAYQGDGTHNHTFSGTTNSTGGGGSHENRPPYYALAYIMKA